MSTRITPRVRSREQLDAAPAKLVATLISVAAAGLVDAGRFRRGRQYALEGAVGELVVAQGVLRGSVMGSRREPYEVRVTTDLVPAPPDAPTRQQLAALVPAMEELEASCTCPDADERPCKHAAAVLLAFAAEAAEDPSLLIAWRCGDVPARARAGVGSRVRHIGPAGRDVAAPVSPFSSPQWQAFFGFAAEMTVPEIDDGDPDLGTEHLGPFDVSAMVRSAHASMRRVIRG